MEPNSTSTVVNILRDLYEILHVVVRNHQAWNADVSQSDAIATIEKHRSHLDAMINEEADNNDNA